MVTTRLPKTIVKPTALGPVANTDTKLLIYGLFQKGRVLAQDGEGSVPALQYYPRKLTLSSKENVVLTRNNVLLNDKKKPAAWDLLVNALL